MDKILCLQFNNMYNKKVKKVNNIADYYANSANWKIIDLNNFLPGDGIVTSDNWNWDEEWFPDYIVHYNTEDDLTVNPSNMNHIQRIRVSWSTTDPNAYQEYTLDACPYVNQISKTIDLETWNNDLALRYNWQAEKLLDVKFFCTPFPANELSLTMKDVVIGTGIDVGGGSDIIIGEASFSEVQLDGSDFRLPEGTMINTIWINEEEVQGNIVEFHLPSTVQFLDLSNNVQPIDRWYVVHSERNRAGQYKFQFYRDLVADNLDEILKMPAFIEKGYVDPKSDLIFNKEGFSFNQIKKSEIPLMDNTKTPWIVGYIPFDLQEKTGQYNIHDDVVWNYTGNSYEWSFLGQKSIVTNISDWQFRICGQYNNNANRGRKCWLGYDFDDGKSYNGNDIDDGNGILFAPGATFYDSILMTDWKYYTKLKSANKNNVFMENTLIDKLNAEFGSITNDSLNQLISLNGQLVRFDDGVYRLKISDIQDKNDQVYTTKGTTANEFTKYVGTRFLAWIGEVLDVQSGQGYNDSHKLLGEFYYSSRSVNISLEAVLESEHNVAYNWKLSGVGRRLKDNPYRMFAIPLSGVKFNFSGDIYNTTELENLEAAINISSKLVSSQEIYDLQLLPYCPIRNIYRNNKEELVIPSYLVENRDYSWITYGTTEENEKRSVILYPSESTFSFQIQQPIQLDNIKIQNETDLYRVCSPNYSAAFDFNVAMNRGVNYWNVYCTYKPYSPYIQVSPAFSGLYGDNFNDFRGLVCAGDFSLPLTDDAWTTYELNNKNYQNMFDRQIQNMEVMNKLALTQATVQAVTGTVTGAASGAMTGAVAGGGVGGAIAGGVIGGAASLAGGIWDIDILKKQQAETMSYTKDVYLMQLQNIQALPTTLSRISSLNANNKFFPFIEHYTCTDVERKAFEDYLKYNGMTVNVIGNINEYVGPDETFIKAQLIRSENSSIDYHELVEIAKLLKEGVYI